ncbi:MAG: YhjD/YihY/BrkB family envelope integrity protein [Actinomycetota bacterium]|jgi:membrane protein
MKAKLARLGERWPWLGWVLKAQDRYRELNGNYLAAAVTLAGFLSLFPLLLVGLAVLGFVSAGRVDLAGDLVERLGLTGEAATFVGDLIRQTENSRQVASVVGLAGLLWTGLGAVAAAQYVLNGVWQVKGRGLADKARGVGWLAGAGLLLTVSLAATAAAGLLPPWLAVVGPLAALAVDVALWTWTFKVLTNRSLPWLAYLPGAVVGAVGFGVLKAVGGFYVPRLVASASVLYGSFAVIFAILAWLLFFGRLVVYAAVANVIAWEARHGTVTVELAVPKVAGEVPVEATRAGEASPATSGPGPGG